MRIIVILLAVIMGIGPAATVFAALGENNSYIAFNARVKVRVIDGDNKLIDGVQVLYAMPAACPDTPTKVEPVSSDTQSKTSTGTSAVYSGKIKIPTAAACLGGPMLSVVLPGQSLTAKTVRLPSPDIGDKSKFLEFIAARAETLKEQWKTDPKKTAKYPSGVFPFVIDEVIDVDVRVDTSRSGMTTVYTASPSISVPKQIAIGGLRNNGSQNIISLSYSGKGFPGEITQHRELSGSQTKTQVLSAEERDRIIREYRAKQVEASRPKSFDPYQNKNSVFILGKVYGDVVTNQNGNISVTKNSPLKNIDIEIRDSEGRSVSSVVSDENGVYYFGKKSPLYNPGSHSYSLVGTVQTRHYTVNGKPMFDETGTDGINFTGMGNEVNIRMNPVVPKKPYDPNLGFGIAEVITPGSIIMLAATGLLSLIIVRRLTSNRLTHSFD